MHILALEPYYGGSHRAFLDGWSRRSEHQFTILELPAYKWKWRMRHAAITFAQQLKSIQLEPVEPRWDALFCSDMLNLAEFAGLVGLEISQLPRVIYFHENQWTYPYTKPNERDHHYGFSNFVSAVAADEVWFNSAFHRDDFLEATAGFLRRMPDHQPLESVDEIRKRSHVAYPGVQFPAVEFEPRAQGPLRIAWAARWEHDKDPGTFFEAIERLAGQNVPFELSVVGESFGNEPEVFAKARALFGSRIRHWGFQESVEAYRDVLRESDVFVSTARHEFFGISTVEAIAEGCYPLLPRRLSYPELLQDGSGTDETERFFYDGTAEGLAECLSRLAADCQASRNFIEISRGVRDAARRFEWSSVAKEMDKRIHSLVEKSEEATLPKLRCE